MFNFNDMKLSDLKFGVSWLNKGGKIQCVVWECVWVAGSRPTVHATCFGEFYKKKTEPVKGFFVLSFLRPREKPSESVFVYSHPGDVSNLTAHSYKRGRTPSPLSGSLPLSVLPSLLFLQQIGLRLGHKLSLAVWLEINNGNEDNLLQSRVQYRSFSICLHPDKHSGQNHAAEVRSTGNSSGRVLTFRMNNEHESHTRVIQCHSSFFGKWM